MIDIPIPKLRKDLLYKNIKHNNEDLVLVYDDLGLIEQFYAFSQQDLDVIKLIDGKNSIESIVKQLNMDESKIPLILGFINSLANSNYLETESYHKQNNEIISYLKSNLKPSVCDGVTYPDDKQKLTQYLNLLLNSTQKSNEKYNVIFAPHLDYRTGKNTHLTYSKAFNSIDINNTELVVLFGTAHYRSSNDFMYTKKNYSTPLGIIETDIEFLKLVDENLSNGLFLDDLAHYKEHSLELHITFLQHIFNNNVKIAPILIGSPSSYFNNGYPSDSSNYLENINSLKDALKKYNKKTLFLASGDLSHIGKKFGDEFDSNEKKVEIMNYDLGIIDSINNKDKNQFFDYLRSENELRRVCGAFPFYAMLDLTNPTKSKNLYYNLWYEEETMSSVSICSMGLSTDLS